MVQYQFFTVRILTSIFFGIIFLAYMVFPHFFYALAFRIASPIFMLAEGVPLEVKILELKQDVTEKNVRGKTLLPLYIITRPPQTKYDTLIAKNYSKEKPRIGSYVYTSEGVLVGVVTSVVAEDGVVLELFSTPSRQDEYTIQGVVLLGQPQGNGSIAFDIPKKIKVAVGDQIVFQKNTKHHRRGR